MRRIHASCVEIAGAGVLLRGVSGSGKSDLALRLIDEGGRLVADDQVMLRTAALGLRASCPKLLAGMIEIHGVGPVTLPADKWISEATIQLVADLVDAGPIERMPERDACVIEGVTIPVMKVYPFHASATAKVRAALTCEHVLAEAV